MKERAMADNYAAGCGSRYRMYEFSAC